MYIWLSQYYIVDFSRKHCSELLELLKDIDPSLQNQLKLILLKVFFNKKNIMKNKK